MTISFDDLDKIPIWVGGSNIKSVATSELGRLMESLPEPLVRRSFRTGSIPRLVRNNPELGPAWSINSEAMWILDRVGLGIRVAELMPRPVQISTSSDVDLVLPTMLLQALWATRVSSELLTCWDHTHDVMPGDDPYRHIELVMSVNKGLARHTISRPDLRRAAHCDPRHYNYLALTTMYQLMEGLAIFCPDNADTYRQLTVGVFLNSAAIADNSPNGLSSRLAAQKSISELASSAALDIGFSGDEVGPMQLFRAPASDTQGLAWRDIIDAWEDPSVPGQWLVRSLSPLQGDRLTEEVSRYLGLHQSDRWYRHD